MELKLLKGSLLFIITVLAWAAIIHVFFSSILSSQIVVDFSKYPTLLSLEKVIHAVNEVLRECEHPFQWRLDKYERRPFTLKNDKFCHYSWEKFLRPYLWRLIWAYESVLKNNIPIAVHHLKLADKLFRREASSKGKLFLLIEKSLSHIFFATIAHLFVLKKHFYTAYKCLEEIKPIIKMTPTERAGIYGAKAIILSAYGQHAKLDALANIIKALRITPNEAEWRFVFIELMCDLYDVNIGTKLVVMAIRHMPYTPVDDVSSGKFIFWKFSKYFRNTWPQRNVKKAARNILLALDELPRVQDNAERVEELHLQVVLALETDPFSEQILVPAIQFYLQCDIHKALALSSIGKTLYRDCAESWLDTLHLLYPLEAFDIGHVLQYYTESWSLPIRKRAALWYLDISPSITFSMALRILEIENKEWAYQLFKDNREFLEHIVDPPFFLWSEYINTGFYKIIACYASFLESNPEGRRYLNHYEDVTNVKISFHDLSCQESLIKLINVLSKNVFYKVSNDNFVNQLPPELIFVDPEN